MQIESINTVEFTYRSKRVRDEEGQTHPGDPHDALMTLTEVTTTNGVVGRCFGGSQEANQLISKYIVGMDPLYHEKIWQYLKRKQRRNDTITDRCLAKIDCALWDIAGKYADLPIYKLLGGYRDSVPAYASTMVGDHNTGGLSTPDAYADFAEELLNEGYKAIKLHTWSLPTGPDPEKDISTCQAVRERVGEEVDLMLDPYHFYNRLEARKIGQALEDLDFLWLEEPMEEYSMSSYKWLSNELDIPLIGPELAEGKNQTRAEWVSRDISDISRISVHEAGGITPVVKTIHLCESFGIPCELHRGGAATLQVLGAAGNSSKYYERGLLHPQFDYETSTPWLKCPLDPLSKDGTVEIPEQAGLGYEIDWEYIEKSKISSDSDNRPSRQNPEIL